MKFIKCHDFLEICNIIGDEQRVDTWEVRVAPISLLFKAAIRRTRAILATCIFNAVYEFS